MTSKKLLSWMLSLLSLPLLHASAFAQTEPSAKPQIYHLDATTSSAAQTTPVAYDTANSHPATVSPNTKSGLSFDFQDVSIKTLLQIIAKNSGINFVISDSVKGSMSLSLQKVTWQQALDVVMRANGLDSRRYNNVMIVAPIDELVQNDIKRLQAEQQVSSLALPTSTIIHLRYANANDLAAVIKGQQSTLLSANGQVGVDPRTNVIWIRDSQDNIDKVKAFIQQLDIPAKQILIEARIVSIDTAYAKELGVRWGVSNMRNLTGTLEGASEIRNGTSMTAVPVNQRLSFNMPAQSVFGAQPASMGLALVHLGPGYLDLELSALEGEQHGQVIANPRVVTSNLQKATIETGQEIPYQEATSSGATSITFKKAVLSLEITPQITSDNNVVLDLKVTQDKQAAGIINNGTTIPTIDTQAVQSYVQLKDQETIVIGGVYKETKNSTMQRIPFLSSLPLIGGMFKYQHEDVSRNELLIFITPKLVTPSTIGVMSDNEQKANRLSLNVNKGVKIPKNPPKSTSAKSD